MKKYVVGIVFFLLLVLIILFLFINNKPSIVGKWKSVGKKKEYYYIFNKDKTCSYEMKAARLNCTYKVDDSKLIVLYDGNEKTTTFEYRFEKKVLIITDPSGKDNLFIKAK